MTVIGLRVHARSRGVCAAGHSRGGHTNHRNGFVRRTICPPERVLRYPDGKERRIRYPSTGLALEECAGLEETLHTVSSRRLAEEASVEDAVTGQSDDVSELDLSSPLAFLRYVTSEEYTRRLEEENRTVRGTFDVHASCPWVVPRKVWTLGIGGGRANGEDMDDGRELDGTPPAASVFYLRTRSPSTAVENELNSLLFPGSKKKKKKENKKIRCSSLVDGIVLFTEESDAEAFAESMSTDASLSVAEHDSHEIFRHIVECRGVAVIMKPGFGDDMEACGMGLQGFPERLKAVLLDRWSDEGEDASEGGEPV